MDIILSIKPEFIEKIIRGEKNYEFRRKVWKHRDIKRVYIYATAPIKKIVGYFTYKLIIKGDPKVLWQHCQDEAGISESEFMKYFKGISLGYAIKIDMLQIYRMHKDPIEMVPNFHAPQSFMYYNNGSNLSILNIKPIKKIKTR